MFKSEGGGITPFDTEKHKPWAWNESWKKFYEKISIHKNKGISIAKVDQKQNNPCHAYEYKWETKN